MKIVFFSNPDFFADQTVSNFTSMPRFTQMLVTGMRQRGHKVEVWVPKAKFFLFPLKNSIKKWLGYIDKYIVFPAQVKRLLRECDSDTLFVFTDQAQGPWVPLASNRYHVIHCHDFLSQHSASGKIPENPTGLTGRLYQNFIRSGYSKGKNFISVSRKTQGDLHQIMTDMPGYSEVVYNALNRIYKPCDPDEARRLLSHKTGFDLSSGYLLHVGGNLWYKNRIGVLEIYNSWRSVAQQKLPLVMIGDPLAPNASRLLSNSPFRNDVHLLTGMSDEYVRLAYAGASVFIFPSLAEGFGWPIAEAMACGCPVVTTNEAPMTEVAGDAGFFIPRRPYRENEVEHWGATAAKVINKVLLLAPEQRNKVISEGLLNIKRFDLDHTLNSIERVYQNIVHHQQNLV